MFRRAILIAFCLSAVFNTATAGRRGLAVLDTIIKVSVSSSHSYKPINVVINKTGNMAKIIYSIFDDIDSEALIADTAFANADKLFRAGKPEPAMALANKYHVYLYDTLNVSAPDLNHQIDLLLRSYDKELTSDFKNRVVLDGTRVGVEIITTGGTRKISANSPTTDYQPILYSFLQQLFSTYRQNTKKNILQGNGY